MATTAATGMSTARDARTAGRQAARQACDALGGAAPDLLMMFATSRYEQQALLDGAREAAPGARLSGCSGEGVIAGPLSDETRNAAAVLAVRSDRFRFDTFLVPDYSADPVAAGEALLAAVRAAGRDDALGLMLFPDGLRGNCGELLRALDAGRPPGLQIVGGTAGDALVFERTWQYHDSGAASDAVAAVLVSGRGCLEVGVSHGCSPIGLERRVTRADGGWLREIDGRPAWAVFREYLDGDPQELNTEGAIHLSIGEPLPEGAAADYEPFIIRTPLGLDRETGSLFFPGGGIREGRTIRLARRDPERIREQAEACAARLADRRGGEMPALVIQFDCAGRGRQLFGSRTAEHIVRPLQARLGTTTPWIGFHTYGEIAPIGGATFFHNFTVALCAFYDGTDGA